MPWVPVKCGARSGDRRQLRYPLWHSSSSPRAHAGQLSQVRKYTTETRSPTASGSPALSWVRRLRSVTSAMISCPMTIDFSGWLPANMCSSEPHTPAARVRTSRAPSGSSGSSYSRISSLPGSTM